MTGGRIPRPELNEMLEVDDAARVVLAEVGAVQEVHVDRRADDAMGRQQLAEIQISGRRVLERRVVAVCEDHQRKRAAASGNTDVPVQRDTRIEKRPRRGSEIGKWRDIDAWRHVARRGRVVDRVLIERRDARVVAASRRVNHRVEWGRAGNGGVVQFCHASFLGEWRYWGPEESIAKRATADDYFERSRGGRSGLTAAIFEYNPATSHARPGEPDHRDRRQCEDARRRTGGGRGARTRTRQGWLQDPRVLEPRGLRRSAGRHRVPREQCRR